LHELQAILEEDDLHEANSKSFIERITNDITLLKAILAFEDRSVTGFSYTKKLEHPTMTHDIKDVNLTIYSNSAKDYRAETADNDKDLKLVIDARVTADTSCVVDVDRNNNHSRINGIPINTIDETLDVFTDFIKYLLRKLVQKDFPPRTMYSSDEKTHLIETLSAYQ
jgi:hypothetical protein